MSHVWPSVLANFLIFFVTLSLWPTVIGDACVVPLTENNPKLTSWWFDIVMLTFNLGDFIGKSEKYTLQWGTRVLSPKVQLALAVLRAVIFFPLILTASAPQLYSPASARWVLLFGTLGVGLSNGWLSSVCFMRAPKALPEGTRNEVAEQATSLLYFGLFLGLAFGALAAFVAQQTFLKNHLHVCYS
uniref:Equilibrative nucleoside transporter 1 n=1 Tax=Noctiluca scintillans TaxID=2966 RepID=A0A7S1AGF5_NOCSC